MQQRPTGVTILAILAAIGGIFGLLGGVALIGLSSATANLALPLSGLVGILGLFLIVVSIGELAFAYGAWTLRPWAWLLGVALEIAAIVIDVLTIRSDTLSSTIVSIVIAGLILYYLYQPHVRRAFGQSV